MNEAGKHLARLRKGERPTRLLAMEKALAHSRELAAGCGRT